MATNFRNLQGVPMRLSDVTQPGNRVGRTPLGPSPLVAETSQGHYLRHAPVHEGVSGSRPAPPATPAGDSTGRVGASRSSAARHRGGLVLVGLLIALIVAMRAAPGAAQSSASYQIPRQSIDGGAARATSASYTLNGTIGQPDAGATSTSASYTLSGGFHRAAPTAPLPDSLFANGFESP